MVQLISISKARSNFSSLVTQVAQTKQPIVIVRESEPVATIIPYNKQIIGREHLDKLLSIKGDWFDEDDYKQIRKEVEERITKLHHEK